MRNFKFDCLFCVIICAIRHFFRHFFPLIPTPIQTCRSLPRLFHTCSPTPIQNRPASAFPDSPIPHSCRFLRRFRLPGLPAQFRICFPPSAGSSSIRLLHRLPAPDRVSCSSYPRPAGFSDSAPLTPSLPAPSVFVRYHAGIIYY